MSATVAAFDESGDESECERRNEHDDADGVVRSGEEAGAVIARHILLELWWCYKIKGEKLYSQNIT